MKNNIRITKLQNKLFLDVKHAQLTTLSIDYLATTLCSVIDKMKQ